MNKLYLLPISLFLLNQGFADEDTAKKNFSEVKIVSQGSLLQEAIEIDAQLVEELKEEISAILQEDSENEVVSTEEKTKQSDEKKQKPHVRHYPNQAPATPKSQAGNQRPKQQNPQPAKTLKAQPNTVDVQKKSNGNRVSTAPANASVRSKNVAQMEDMQDQTNSQNEMGMKQGSQKMMPVNKPTRPMVKNGYDFWIMGDVLLWQAVEENLTYVYSGNDSSTEHNRTLHTVDFNWDWGFRLGAGYNTPRDGWDLDLYWTHIRNTAHEDEKSDEDDELFQVWTVAASPLLVAADEAKGTWRVHLDQLDLDLGRQFYVGKYLSIRPYVGMRSTWLYQTYDVELSSASSEQEAELKNRFWGFGFAGGLDSEWNLGYGISLYGEADMSILLGFFDVDQKGTQDDSSIWSQDKSFRAGRAIMDLGLGLKWNRLFSDDRYGLTLKAGYEYHLYFDQNQFILSNGNSAFELFNPVNGDLVYQGVIGSIQIDF